MILSLREFISGLVSDPPMKVSDSPIAIYAGLGVGVVVFVLLLCACVSWYLLDLFSRIKKIVRYLYIGDYQHKSLCKNKTVVVPKFTLIFPKRTSFPFRLMFFL